MLAESAEKEAARGIGGAKGAAQTPPPGRAAATPEEGGGSAQAVRFGKWKAIRKPMFTGPIELYDMSNDPGEKSNYAKRRPDLARHAANLLDKMHTPDPNWKVRGRRK